MENRIKGGKISFMNLIDKKCTPLNGIQKNTIGNHEIWKK